MTTAHTETVDKYLEAIYYIDAEGEVVRPSRLAYWLSVSAPTVSNALVRLKRDGWIDVGSDRSVTLTDSGRATATSLVRRHRILERWLTDVLGFDWASADVEADRLSSAISDAVVDQIDTSMGSPSTCPHGNVIPGRDAPYGVLIALADLEPDVSATVRRISEVAEHDAPALLSMLAAHSIHEGSEVRVTEAAVSPGDVALTVAGNELTLTLDAARLIWVQTT
ncbi:MAG TPA: metal-dependent transcriptional regulator [Acidimicrobiales bacterium]|jgi:DtxR family Mn-dependent transcriptional regulator